MFKTSCVAFFLFALFCSCMALVNVAAVYNEYSGHVSYQNVFLFEDGVKASFFAMLFGISLLLAMCSATISKLIGE